MSVWMELRCERRTRAGTGCWSNVNAGPMEMAADDQRSVIAVTRLLFAEARAGGWKRTKDGWVCPNCAAAPEPSE